MKQINSARKSTIDPVKISNWRWQSFLNLAINKLDQFELKSFPVSQKFLDKEVILGSKKNPLKVNISTWACHTNKIRKARAACLEAKNLASVLNFVITPQENFDLPFFGADFVTLPTFHLLALDLQPALENDIQHTQNVWNRLMPLHRRWSSLLPFGGPIPQEAEKYFSPGFLWTKIPIGVQGDKLIREVITPAFNEYLSLYLELLISSEEVEKNRSEIILEGQKSYLKYRAINDPARPMLERFFGTTWTEDYINTVLFDQK